MKKLLASLTVIALLVCALLPLPSHSQGRAAQAKFRRVTRAVPGQYIVVLNNNAVGRGGVAPVAQALAQAHGGQIIFVYESALKGFAVRLPEPAAQALSRDPRVKFVEEDAQGEVAATQFSPPNWGLDRIDQRDRPVDGQYNYNSSGTGVWVYVIDTGIRSSHVDFGGRSWLAADYIHDGCEDCNGHGTHVAGIIGSATYGVAKNSYPLAVKVCNSAGQCNASTVIAGINYVTQFHQNWPTIPSVANISLRFAPNSSMDTAVRNSLAAGVTYTIAAGNETQNAANNSPARVSEELTVAASDYNDQRAYFSNFGSVVDLFAPGFGIVSTYNRSNTDSAELSGTSMAAPHVAGVAALYLEGRTDRISMSPTVVNQIIKANATPDAVSDPGFGSPDRLLYMGFTPAPANPIDDTRFFVWQLYGDLLNREPDSGGMGGWSSFVEGCGGDPQCLVSRRTETARGFIDSGEFRNSHPLLQNPPGSPAYNEEFVRQCYLVFLRRTYDQGGYDAWLNYLNTTGDELGVIHGFIYSYEYRNRFGQP